MRAKELLELGKTSRENYVSSWIKEEIEVLVEKIAATGNARGYTANYIEVEIPAELNFGDWKIGDIIRVRLEKSMLINEKY